jgi:hypothetical protein
VSVDKIGTKPIELITHVAEELNHLPGRIEVLVIFEQEAVDRRDLRASRITGRLSARELRSRDLDAACLHGADGLNLAHATPPETLF